jgi:hypothetical protein
MESYSRVGHDVICRGDGTTLVLEDHSRQQESGT